MAAITTQVVTTNDATQVTLTLNGTAYTWTAQQFRWLQKVAHRVGTNLNT